MTINVSVANGGIKINASPPSAAVEIKRPFAASVEIKTARASAAITTADTDIGFASPIVKEYVGAEPYEGSYTVTPSEETQTLYTNAKRMLSDVVIAPIPSNYGKITRYGSTITVS